MKTVSVEEFAAHPLRNLCATEPFEVRKGGTSLGYFVPAPKMGATDAEEDGRELIKLLHQAADELGMTQEEFEAEFAYY